MSSIPTSSASRKALPAASSVIPLKFPQPNVKSLQHGFNVGSGQDHCPPKPTLPRDASPSKTLKSKENQVLIHSPPKSLGHSTKISDIPLAVNLKENTVSKSSVYAGGPRLLLQRLHGTPPKSTTVPLTVPMVNFRPEIVHPRPQDIPEDHEPPTPGHIIIPTDDSSQISSADSIDELLLSPSHLNENVQVHVADTATHLTPLPKVAISDSPRINGNNLKFIQNVKKPISSATISHPSYAIMSSQEIKESTMVYVPRPSQIAIRSNLRHLKRAFSDESTSDHADSVNLKRSHIICQQTITPTDKYLCIMQDFFGAGDDRRGEGFKPERLPEVPEIAAGDAGEGLTQEPESMLAECSERAFREMREETRQRGSSASDRENHPKGTSVKALKLLKNDPIAPPENTSKAKVHVQAARGSSKRKTSITSRLA